MAATMTQLAAGASGPDPHEGLRAVAALRRLLEEVEARHVAVARAAGWSWSDIADVLGVSKQAVHRKHRKER